MKVYVNIISRYRSSSSFRNDFASHIPCSTLSVWLLSQVVTQELDCRRYFSGQVIHLSAFSSHAEHESSHGLHMPVSFSMKKPSLLRQSSFKMHCPSWVTTLPGCEHFVQWSALSWHSWHSNEHETHSFRLSSRNDPTGQLATHFPWCRISPSLHEVQKSF